MSVAITHEYVEVVALIGGGSGIKAWHGTMLATSEFRMVSVEKGCWWGMLGAGLDFVKQGHCATTKMGVINEEIFPFFGGEIGLFQLNGCRIVNYLLV